MRRRGPRGSPLVTWLSDIGSRAGRVRELNRMNWTERTERRHFAAMPWAELNELSVDPTKQANWTERTFVKRFWTEFPSLCATPHLGRVSRHSQQTQPPPPPPRLQNPGRRAGISAGGDLEFFLCSSQTIGGSMDWTKPELNWTVPMPRTELNELSRQAGD